MDKILFDELRRYVDDEVIRYDVPGHKGNPEVLQDLANYFGENLIKADVNSMQRLDNMNLPIGLIKRAQDNIAELHGADFSRFLINGTTSGIQMMIMASVSPGEKILVPRNAHTSVTAGLVLSGASVIYGYPEFDGELGVYTFLRLEEVKKKLHEHPDIKTVLLINPSYHGFVSEFEEIVTYCKTMGKIVIVDEAHGGQFYFSRLGYTTAMDAGADLTCISYHKTLGSLTQSSLLLGKDNGQISLDRLQEMYRLLNTTSPSYLLMTSIEVAADYLETNGAQKFAEINVFVEEARAEINRVPGFTIVDENYMNGEKIRFDFSKILIRVQIPGMSGFELYKMLRDEYNIQSELAEAELVLLVLGIGDREENLSKVVGALREISSSCSVSEQRETKRSMSKIIHLSEPVDLRKCFYGRKKRVLLEDSVGEICGESVMLYPPGIDIVKMGEQFTPEIVEYLKEIQADDLDIIGILDEKVTVIEDG